MSLVNEAMYDYWRYTSRSDLNATIAQSLAASEYGSSGTARTEIACLKADAFKDRAQAAYHKDELKRLLFFDF